MTVQNILYIRKIYMTVRIQWCSTILKLAVKKKLFVWKQNQELWAAFMQFMSLNLPKLTLLYYTITYEQMLKPNQFTDNYEFLSSMRKYKKKVHFWSRQIYKLVSSRIFFMKDLYFIKIFFCSFIYIAYQLLVSS